MLKKLSAIFIFQFEMAPTRAEQDRRPGGGLTQVGQCIEEQYVNASQ